MIDPIRDQLERRRALVADLRDWSSGRFRIETGELSDQEREVVMKAAPAFFTGIVFFLHFRDYWIVYGVTLMALMITIGAWNIVDYINKRF